MLCTRRTNHGLFPIVVHYIAEPLRIMPKLYEYFGLIVMFYANEHEPVHVHGKFQGCESRADDIVAKWIDFFVLHKPITPERITRRLK